MTPKLIPYKAEHILRFTDRDGERLDVRSAIIKEQGPAFTAIIGETIIGCAGILPQWDGMGIAWVVFSKEAEHHMVWCTRTIRNVMRDLIRAFKLHRLELTVLLEMDSYQRWAALLGFSVEKDGYARAYTTTKRDVLRMEMIIQ